MRSIKIIEKKENLNSDSEGQAERKVQGKTFSHFYTVLLWKTGIYYVQNMHNKSEPNKCMDNLYFILMM